MCLFGSRLHQRCMRLRLLYGLFSGLNSNILCNVPIYHILRTTSLLRDSHAVWTSWVLRIHYNPVVFLSGVVRFVFYCFLVFFHSRVRFFSSSLSGDSFSFCIHVMRPWFLLQTYRFSESFSLAYSPPWTFLGVIGTLKLRVWLLLWFQVRNSFQRSEFFTIHPRMFRLFLFSSQRNRLGCEAHSSLVWIVAETKCILYITVRHWVSVRSPFLSFLAMHFFLSPIGIYLFSRVPVGLGIVAVLLLNLS